MILLHVSVDRSMLLIIFLATINDLKFHVHFFNALFTLCLAVLVAEAIFLCWLLFPVSNVLFNIFHPQSDSLFHFLKNIFHTDFLPPYT